MNPLEYLTSIAIILAIMAAAALLEVAVPLYAGRRQPQGRHLANLAMTAQTLTFNFLLTSAAALAALVLPLASPGLMTRAGMPVAAQFVVGIVVLDFAFGYFAHRAMHMWPSLWKVHRVHHSDPFVDVTTTYRSHPIESAWRYFCILVPIWALGIPASAVVLYRVLSAANAIFEHANIRVRRDLDAAASRVWVTPNMHKVHHSREQAETDTNYGNLLSLHDRLFGTFTPSERAFSVVYGLEDVDPRVAQSFGALLAMPWAGRGRL